MIETIFESGLNVVHQLQKTQQKNTSQDFQMSTYSAISKKIMV